MTSVTRTPIVAVSLALASWLTLSALAQERPTFRVQSDLVVVHAMVEDGRGAAVAGLGVEHFLLYEDNVPQTITLFSAADAPASIGLLVDNSTSMISKRERVVAAAVQFAELSNPEDEVFVLAFNEHVREAWPPGILAESDIGVLRATLLNRISARGQTALYDAVHGGLDRLGRGQHTRQVLVIVSDGGDNASRAALDATLARIRASNVMIYCVILSDDLDRDADPGLLKRLSRDTGGEAFQAERVRDIPEALAHIARDIRATYTLGYVPANQARDGTTRKLRVVASRDGRPLEVRTRTAYRAPAGGTRGGGGGR